MDSRAVTVAQESRSWTATSNRDQAAWLMRPNDSFVDVVAENLLDRLEGYVLKKNRIHYSGPLMHPGGNIEDILKEHETQIQPAVRKVRLEKSGTNNNGFVSGQPKHLGRYRQ